MCMISAIGNEWAQTAPITYPWVMNPPAGVTPWELEVVKQELKADIEALRQLLLTAKDYDVATGQPDCEMDEKVELIKKFAELVGVDLDDIFSS